MIGRRGFIASLVGALVAPSLPVPASARVVIEAPVVPVEVQGYFVIADLLRSVGEEQEQNFFQSELDACAGDFDRLLSRYEKAAVKSHPMRAPARAMRVLRKGHSAPPA